jgi:hypothetical protein
LLHRIAAELGVGRLLTPTPMRVPRGKVTIAGGIEKAVSAAAIRVQGDGGVLVLLDADDDCPAQLAPQLHDSTEAQLRAAVQSAGRAL